MEYLNSDDVESIMEYMNRNSPYPPELIEHVRTCTSLNCPLCGNPRARKVMGMDSDSFNKALADKARRDEERLQKIKLSSEYGMNIKPEWNTTIQLFGQDGENYDLIIMCRYITYMYDQIKRLEPFIDDMAEFMSFMKDFKHFAKDDLETLNDLLGKGENAEATEQAVQGFRARTYDSGKSDPEESCSA